MDRSKQGGGGLGFPGCLFFSSRRFDLDLECTMRNSTDTSGFLPSFFPPASYPIRKIRMFHGGMFPFPSFLPFFSPSLPRVSGQQLNFLAFPPPSPPCPPSSTRTIYGCKLRPSFPLFPPPFFLPGGGGQRGWKDENPLSFFSPPFGASPASGSQ